MELEVGSSNRSPYGFEKLNDGNYATWAFDVKYQFLKEKLWGLVSGTESPPVRRVPVSTALETADLTADAAAALQTDEEHRAALSLWEDKVNAATLVHAVHLGSNVFSSSILASTHFFSSPVWVFAQLLTMEDRCTLV
jgi:hypothetical protein